MRHLGWIVCLVWFAGIFSSPACAALSFTYAGNGLATLTYNGTSLLRGSTGGIFFIERGTLQRSNGTTYAAQAGYDQRYFGTYDGEDTVTISLQWGTAACRYTQQGDTLYMDLTVHNTTADTMTSMNLVPATLLFPTEPPLFTTLDGGWTGEAYTGNYWGSLAYTVSLLPENKPPVLYIDYGSDVLAFSSEEMDAPVGVWNNSSIHQMWVLWRDPVGPGQTKTHRVSFRFAPETAGIQAVCGDLLEKYYAAYPGFLQWDNRKALIMDCVLANGITPTAKNPRCYQTNQDLRTEAGKLAFRNELQNRATSQLAMLQTTGGQGTIIWSIEGIEGNDIMYEGDPRRVALAPEMEYQVDGVATVDAYLKRFTDAGYQVGHCLRPQQLRSTPLELGTVFRPTVDGTVTKLRVYSTFREPYASHTARIWRNSDNTVIAGPFEWVYGNEDGWQELDIPDVAVAAGVEYTVSISTTSTEPAYAYNHTAFSTGAPSPAPANTPPTGSQELTSFQGPTNFGTSSFIARLRGYLVAPTTGDYTFWISSDDGSELWLSTDDNPAHKQKIAYAPNWCSGGSWTAHATQKSAVISLVAGQRYYVAAVHTEASGGDFVKVGWAKPGQSTTAPSEIIPGSALQRVDGTPGGLDYEYWDNQWLSNGGLLDYQEVSYQSTTLGVRPNTLKSGGTAVLRDIVFHASGDETLYGSAAAQTSAKEIRHDYTVDPVAELVAKVQYCQMRWGSSIFYIDTFCDGTGVLLPGTVIEQVMQACPNVLLLPENQNTRCFSFGSAFDDGNAHGVRWTSERTRMVYPGAFTAIRGIDGAMSTDDRDRFAQGVRQGDIMLFLPYGNGAANTAAIYQAAGTPPTARITFPANHQYLTVPVTITADAADSDGTIAKVEFFRYTVQGGREKIGEDTTAPYSVSWTPPAARQVLAVCATDNAGLTRWSGAVVINEGSCAIVNAPHPAPRRILKVNQRSDVEVDLRALGAAGYWIQDTRTATRFRSTPSWVSSGTLTMHAFEPGGVEHIEGETPDPFSMISAYGGHYIRGIYRVPGGCTKYCSAPSGKVYTRWQLPLTVTDTNLHTVTVATALHMSATPNTITVTVSEADGASISSAPTAYPQGELLLTRVAFQASKPGAVITIQVEFSNQTAQYNGIQAILFDDGAPAAGPNLVARDTVIPVAGATGGSAQTATLRIYNEGNQSLTWTASDDAAWLTASATSGSIAANAYTELTLICNPAGLTSGNTYTGTVTFTSGTHVYPVQVLFTIDGPDGWWKFDELATGSFSSPDASGKGNGCDCVWGGATYQGADGPTWVAGGHVNAAAHFPGVNQCWITSSATTALQPTTALTVVAWAKSDTPTWNAGGGTFVSRRNAYILTPATAGAKTVQFQVYAGGAWRTASYTPTFDITQWHFYAGTYDGANVRLYVDGALVATTAYTGTIGSDVDHIYFGHDDNGGTTPALLGSLDEVRIYLRALSSVEISALYQL